MPALNSLVTQQSNAEPPNIQGNDSGQASGLQGVVGQQPQQQMQAPSHQETVAMLQHMSAFRRRWAAMLKDPEIGTKDMRGDIQDMMADMMADDYASLPQVMGLLKTIPTNPLEQKQFIEKNIANDDKAMQIVLQHHAMGSPPSGTWEQEMAKAGPPVTDENRADLVKGAHSRYKAHGARANQSKGIPVNG